MVATLEHFRRAAADIGGNGDNDTLPFDPDVSFINTRKEQVAMIAHTFYERLAKAEYPEELNGIIRSLEVFAERLLVPAGSYGFRISTKIHPFWNVYLNGLAVAIAEAHEPLRYDRAHSYRFSREGVRLFDSAASWRSFREACTRDVEEVGESAVVVQTDITSFYEHVSHHRVKSLIEQLLPSAHHLALQVDRFLGKLSSGRSFGLPVGGQCSRVLAELLMSEIDRSLTDAGVMWRRYVDDFVLVAPSQQDAYKALASLSHSLADYGLTLNRSKTTFLKGKHFVDYVSTQLGGDDGDATKLREIDLHFDPYSDNPIRDYEELKETVSALDVQALLVLEAEKAQPDTFLVAQIGRTLRLHDENVALQLCETLLSQRNLNAFRASWSTIMRGISAVRGDDQFIDIHEGIDALLDQIPSHSPHLLASDASVLHYLRTLRFARTLERGRFVRTVFDSTDSVTVARACIECWRNWRDRASFFNVRNRWNALGSEVQRMVWLAAGSFGEDGDSFRKQERRVAISGWRLGLEEDGDEYNFAREYIAWSAE